MFCDAVCVDDCAGHARHNCEESKPVIPAKVDLGPELVAETLDNEEC